MELQCRVEKLKVTPINGLNVNIAFEIGDQGVHDILEVIGIRAVEKYWDLTDVRRIWLHRTKEVLQEVKNMITELNIEIEQLQDSLAGPNK